MAGRRRPPGTVSVDTGGGRVTVNTRTGAVIRRGRGGRGEIVETFDEAVERSANMVRSHPHLVTYSPKGGHYDHILHKETGRVTSVKKTKGIIGIRREDGRTEYLLSRRSAEFLGADDHPLYAYCTTLGGLEELAGRLGEQRCMVICRRSDGPPEDWRCAVICGGPEAG